LIANGDLGQITNFRGSFFADYSADANGALSWRFKREFAGSGVLGDLMGHLVDLIHYLVGPVSEVVGMTSTVIKDRPILPMGSATHFAVIEGGERGPVENEDYAGMMVRIGHNGVGAGAIGTLEASRISVGPRAAYNFEIYGTKGSVKWDFERMNEIELALGRSGTNVGYQRIMAGPAMGEFAKFQPGPGCSMGYDDLKVVEAKKFVDAILGNANENSNIHDALAAALVCDAAESSAASKSWISVPRIAGTTAAQK
jgi:predicted dehydrogenase